MKKELLMFYFRKNNLRIIYYHKTTNESSNYYFNIRINFKDFKKQILYLKSKYNIISLSEAIKKTNNKESLHKNLVVTFDDGFSECYNLIFPFLKEHNIHATFFLINNTIDNQDLMWRNKLIVIENLISKQKKIKLINILEEILNIKINKNLNLVKISDLWKMSQKEALANLMWREANIGSVEEYLDKNKPYLTTPQINEMIENNQEIGSHSKTHPYCNKLSLNEINDEIIDSIKQLNKKFDFKIQSFCYPFGVRVNNEVEKIIIKSTNIKTLLGIKDTLSNSYNPTEWERIDMEKPFLESIFFFNYYPYINRLKNYINKKKK